MAQVNITMTIAWFNGPSQDPLISVLPKRHFEVGCNFIERVRSVDAVCVYDQQVIPKIKTKPTTRYYTRPDAQTPGWQVIDDPVLNSTNSGLLALWLAVQESTDPIFIIGCDWGLTDRSCQDLWYGKGYSTRKYTNSIKRKVSKILAGRPCSVVTDLDPDIDLPKISVDQFIEARSYK